MPYLRPHFITQEDWDRVSAIGETVFGALQKVKDAAVDDDSLLDELGITEIERELVKIDPGYSHVSPTTRLDSFLTADSYSYVELNGESPAGIAYADSATEIFRSLPVMKKFAERYDVRGFEGSSKMLDVLLSCYDEFARQPTLIESLRSPSSTCPVCLRRPSLSCSKTISNIAVTTLSSLLRKSWSGTASV